MKWVVLHESNGDEILISVGHIVYVGIPTLSMKSKGQNCMLYMNIPESECCVLLVKETYEQVKKLLLSNEEAYV